MLFKIVNLRNIRNHKIILNTATPKINHLFHSCYFLLIFKIFLYINQLPI